MKCDYFYNRRKLFCHLQLQKNKNQKNNNNKIKHEAHLFCREECEGPKTVHFTLRIISQLSPKMLKGGGRKARRNKPSGKPF